ncbi:hypothetical protein D6D28_09759 [Aureobasidium pullulans]|uniref:Uncharacterized protein n=1 Tax=Aureobasidium pullulans TaxID=5580 RepID=A0A4S8S3I2_AURPU|nr:hypothetical protein D6D28_09759 [Aureobasidium pullulans]
MVHLTAPILLLASLCLLLLTTPASADTEFDFQNHRYKCQRKSGPPASPGSVKASTAAPMSFPSPQNQLAGWMGV